MQFILQTEYHTMKIGIFTDVHANLPALEKAIEIFYKEKCDVIVHVGDLIGIGPYPKECMELAMQQSNMTFIMGNHDYWYGFGLPNPIPKYMSDEEVDHQNWTHQQIGNQYKSVVQQWKFSEDLTLPNGTIINFRHYGLNKEKNWFGTFIKNPTIEGMENLFQNVNAAAIFYGHQHIANHLEGSMKFINLGSAGCWDKSIVRLGILETNKDDFFLKKLFVPYDDDGFIEAFERRKVPARAFILANFVSR